MNFIGQHVDVNLVLPTSRENLSEQEEIDQFIIDTLKSQNEFQGMNLKQVR